MERNDAHAVEPVAPAGVEVDDEALLLRRDAAALEAGVEVVDPAQATALSGPVET